MAEKNESEGEGEGSNVQKKRTATVDTTYVFTKKNEFFFKKKKGGKGGRLSTIPDELREGSDIVLELENVKDVEDGMRVRRAINSRGGGSSSNSKL